MNINPYQLYKVVEIENAIVILNATDSMKHRPEAFDMGIAAPPAQIGEFLARYLHAREKFHTPAAARDEALKGAIKIGRS